MQMEWKGFGILMSTKGFFRIMPRILVPLIKSEVIPSFICSVINVATPTHRVAFPAVGAERALGDVPLAVVGRVLKVDEVSVRVRLEPLK